MPYAVRQTLLDEPNARNGLHRYWRSAFAGHLSDQFIDAAVDAAASFTSPLSAMLFFYMHGAAARVPAADTAFSARRVQWDFDVIGQWDTPAESDRHIGWVRASVGRDGTPHGGPRLHQPHRRRRPTREGPRLLRIQPRRLRQLKAQYDPTNLFRLNPNITPA